MGDSRFQRNTPKFRHTPAASDAIPTHSVDAAIPVHATHSAYLRAHGTSPTLVDARPPTHAARHAATAVLLSAVRISRAPNSVQRKKSSGTTPLIPSAHLADTMSGVGSEAGGLLRTPSRPHNGRSPRTHDVPSGWMLMQTYDTRLVFRASAMYSRPVSVFRPFTSVESLFSMTLLPGGGGGVARTGGDGEAPLRIYPYPYSCMRPTRRVCAALKLGCLRRDCRRAIAALQCGCGCGRSHSVAAGSSPFRRNVLERAYNARAAPRARRESPRANRAPAAAAARGARAVPSKRAWGPPAPPHSPSPTAFPTPTGPTLSPTLGETAQSNCSALARSAGAAPSRDPVAERGFCLVAAFAFRPPSARVTLPPHAHTLLPRHFAQFQQARTRSIYLAAVLPTATLPSTDPKRRCSSPASPCTRR